MTRAAGFAETGAAKKRNKPTMHQPPIKMVRMISGVEKVPVMT